MNLNVESWKEFRLGDLFSEMYKAEAHVKGELECYDVPADNTIRFISRTEMNNGCDCYVLNNDLSGIEEGNAIVIGDTTATCFYQGEDFVCGDHMVICRADWINLHTALFIISILKQEKYKYSYGRAFKMELISNTTIKLPATTDNTPDWDYMEQYIKSLNHKPLTTSNRGQGSCTLDVEKWKECKISDLFNIYTGGDLILSEIEDGEYPIASNSSNNNNIAFYSSFIPNRKLFNHTCSISIADRGAFKAFVQPKDFYIGTRAKGLECKDKDISIASLLFIVTVINQQSFRFSYGYNCCAHLNDMIIKLPMKEDGSINYDFMESYIKSLPYGDRI